MSMEKELTLLKFKSISSDIPGHKATVSMTQTPVNPTSPKLYPASPKVKGLCRVRGVRVKSDDMIGVKG